MGDSKLCLLLLVSTSAFAFAQDNDQPACLLAKRYKTLHKYEYQYQAESLNGINGASPLKNGPKASCTVELEVPQTCSFTLRTSGCSLSEVVDADAQGNPVFEPAPTSNAFAAEMERYPLKFTVEGVHNVKLYPEDGETTTVLNFKRGIISALAVPLLEEDKNRNMPTIHGKCKTFYRVNAREDIATDVSLNRDLSKCDNFVPIRGSTSPLALISGLHYPLAELFSSSQTCNYKFDNEKKHMTAGYCSEKHVLIPFSHKGEYGVTNVGNQELTLVQVSSQNDRVFEHGDIVKGLHMEAVEDKSAVQDKDAFLKLLSKLADLPELEGERRAPLFHELVTMVRGMKAETLSPAIPEALAVSRALTYQVMAQCGTPECGSAIMQILRTFDKHSYKIDATVIALSLISNPSALLINDMLEMAKDKPSKPIMYALSNTVKRFYKAEGKMIPEIHSVAEFMAAQLGDCSGSERSTFTTLRVVGNMAPVVIPASPALRSAVTTCVTQPVASLAVQQAAIQVYRLIPVPEEDREILMRVLLDSASPMQKRVAAYLVLMKDPQLSELVQLTDALSNEPDIQVKSFVTSHINNILTSTEPETQALRQRIREALQGNEIGPIMDRTKFSNNYKIGSVEGNMLFEGTSFLPKAAMLEITLKAFGYDIDMMEIGMEGKGFEPTVDALFGENGFFPDTVLKAMYFVSENVPLGVSEILQNMLPDLKKDRMKRQASTNLIKDIGHNLGKLMRELEASESPEVMVYLRLLGNELGYLRTSEVEEMVYSAAKMSANMFKMISADLMTSLMTTNDNTIFGHYIFMDTEFFLPTVTGVPLKIALSGTFTPGIKGGLKIARDTSEVTFMPSVGIEFVTHIGSHIPEYVNSGLEMHTNIFHESGLNAKISVSRDQVKLTIPAPTSSTKLIKIANTLVAVTGSDVKTIPTVVTNKYDVRQCTPAFAGMKYCSTRRYTNAFDHETSPYFPLTGDSTFDMELHPTGEVTEYTATVAYELIREGEQGRQKVDSVKFFLRAEGSNSGAEPTEARAILKYNRRKNVFTADVQIPDYDVEAGIRLGIANGNAKGKGTHSISLDFLNKNIPQLSLVGRANLKAMKEGMLQGQLIVPSKNAEATVTASMKHDGELEVELKSEIKLMDATSEQKVTLIYGDEKIVVEFKSDVNAKTTSLPGSEVFAKYGNELLDTQVWQTDVKVRHIFKKLIEAANNYVEKYGANIPYIQNFRVPDIPELSLPETLFLTTEAKAAYHFNNEYFTIAVPLPFGGMSTEDLNFPAAVTTPSMSIPQFGLEIVSVTIPIPELVVPESLTMSIALFGKAEVSALVRSNLYNMEASVVVEKNTPSYSATLNVEGASPLDLLSIKIDGLGTVSITDSIKASLKSSLVHKFIEASVSIDEDATITDKINLRSSSKIEVMTPFGVNVGIQHTGMAGINTQEISADNNFEGMFRVGPMYAKTISSQSFVIFPFSSEAKIDSTVQFDSTIVKAQNAISATLANGELSVVSNTKAFDDILTHVAELSFKDRKLSLKGYANALILGVSVQRRTEAFADASKVFFSMETNVEHPENHVTSLLTALLDVNGLAVNSNAILKLLENKATHKATLTVNKDGLTATGSTSLNSPLSLENTFNAGVDSSKATLSITNKAALSDISVNNANTLAMTLSTLAFNSMTQTTVSNYASYTHDITVNLKPYSASANVNNNLNLLEATFNNEANLRAEFFKTDVTGSLKATYGGEEIKHTYEVKYADMTTNAKFSTTGKVFGTYINYNTELEFVGLAATITNDARFNSQPLRFDHSIRCSIVPFDISFDAVFIADGDITMYGKHSAQLYGKYLLKAQPFSFATVHECRASMTNTVDNDFSLETTFNNNMSILLSLQEQRAGLKMTSKMNEHAFNQGISIYNTAERTGIEVSGSILTNILNAESTGNQEFTASAFLKYDKNTDSSIIQFPLIENLPVLLESIKGCVVHIAETLQNYISSYELKASLDGLSQDVIEIISQLKIEDSIIQLNVNFNDFMKQSVSLEDLEASLRKLTRTIDGLFFNLLFFVGSLAGAIESSVSSNAHIQEAWQQLSALAEKYQIPDFINQKINLILPCVEEIVELFPQDPESYIIKVVKDLDLASKINILHAKIKELIIKFEADKIIPAAMEKFAELFKQLRIEETIRDVVQIVKNADIPTKLMQNFNSAINYLKSTDVTNIIEQLNMFIETTAQKLNSLNYNDFVGYTNNVIAECTTYLNELIRMLEIPQKLEPTIDFVRFALSCVKDFMEHLREIKISEIAKLVQDIIDKGVVDNIKGSAEFIKERITNMNFKNLITMYLKVFRKCYVRVITIVDDMFTDIAKTIKVVAPDQKIISEIQQIIDGLSKELKKNELIVPSFPIPLTDLVMPSVVFRMDELEIPSRLDIPEFTILGTYTVKATTISFDDIKQSIIELIDLIVNLDIKLLDVDAFFGDLRMNFLPRIPGIIFPEITVPEISFPTIPKVPVEKLVKSLQAPEIKLPTIPNEIIVPSFGKLYGEVKFLTPIYTLKISGEFQNSTENAMTPQFTGSFNSQATSPHVEILNYNLDSTTRITIPKMRRVVLAETLKFSHLALVIDHQASLSLYGQSAQAQAKTEVKVKTAPYTAIFMNTAFIAMGGGMSASANTEYKHLVDLPCINMRSEAAVTQKAVARQDGLIFSLTVDNAGEGKINDDNGNHKSNLQLSVTPSTVKLTFFGDTDSTILRMKQQITAESGTLSYFKFNVRSEAEAPVIKNSLLVASGHGNLYDMKVELKANHDTELHGEISGVIANALTLVASPFEFVYEFQNKGNAMVTFFKSMSAEIELQNDYSVIVRPDSQQMATVALARLNQFKMFYNFTLDNNENEAGVFVAVENAADLDFLKYPISIPEIDIELPFLVFESQGPTYVNLYDHTGLNLIFPTTEQTVELDAKLVYKKAQPFVEMEILYIGKAIITELSFKSAVINLNANAGLYAEDNLVLRLGATTASEFKSLNAKLHGTTSLTTKRGIKLANSLSLENAHIVGSHDSTISTSTETFETAVAVATAANIALPVLNLEAKHNFAANTKTKANVISTLTVKCDFNLPAIDLVVKAETDHNMKLEGTFEYISLESTTKANMDGKIDKDYLLLGVLDNEVNVYINNGGVRTTSKVIADAKFNHGTTRVIGMDVNENLAIEASLSHVYAVLKYTGNNEAKLINFNTRGKHVVQATIDLAPTSSLAADIEIDIFQPSNLGDLNISEKTVAEVTVPKQKISTSARFSSPLYTTDLEAQLEGQSPVVKVTFKSSGTFDNRLLEYDINASTTANFEKEALNMISKVAVTGADLTMDINHVIAKSPRLKRQADDSASRHTLNVDIASPTVNYANLYYAAGRDGISASVSTPYTGFLGIQVNGPSQMSARFYSRYPSAPEVDVDILVIKSSATDTDEMNLQISYNMETHRVLLSALKSRLISLISYLTSYVDELLTELTKDFATALDRTFNSIFAETEVYYTVFVNHLSVIEIQMPDGDVITGDKLWDEVETAFKKIYAALMETVKNMESLLDAVEKLEEFFHSFKSDYLDAVIMDINARYENLATELKNIVDNIIVQYSEQELQARIYLVDVVFYVIDQYGIIYRYVSEFLKQLSEDAKPYIDVSEDRLEINLTFPFQQ